jgi:hypothetical protein
MTTRVYSQFPRLDSHQLDTQHYGLRTKPSRRWTDCAIACRNSSPATAARITPSTWFCSTACPPITPILKDCDVELLREWNARYEFPKLAPATDAEYYAYIKENFADKLPVYRGDAGAYWEDGAGSSAAETALNRDTQRLLPAGEMFAALASALDSGLRYPSEEFRDAWKDVLFYDEHTWGANVSISQPDRQFVADQWENKRAHAERSRWAAKDLLSRSLNPLVQFISVDGATLFVMNPEPWERTGVVEVELDQNRGLTNVETGVEVPLDIVTLKPGFVHGRFLGKSAAHGLPRLSRHAADGLDSTCRHAILGARFALLPPRVRSQNRRNPEPPGQGTRPRARRCPQPPTN